jgi:hypothetical protein
MISRDSPDWRVLKSWLITQIHKEQRQLEEVEPSIPERTHDVTRGKIAAYRGLLREVEPEKRVEASELEDQPLDSRTDY